MVNCNPETVSTDYDTSDRLYFEPLTLEDVLEVVHAEQQAGPVLGVIVQLGGQTPLGLAQRLKDAGVPIVGTSPEAIHLAEDRGAFGRVLADAGLLAPKHGTATSYDEARRIAADDRLPGAGAAVVRARRPRHGDRLRRRAARDLHAPRRPRCRPDHPVLVDRFLDDAIEIDVDALFDGEELYLGGVMEHIEEAGIHSGDSACALPPITLGRDEIGAGPRPAPRRSPAASACAACSTCSTRWPPTCSTCSRPTRGASRTVPFVSKATGVPLAKAAARVMLGATDRRAARRGPAARRPATAADAAAPTRRSRSRRRCCRSSGSAPSRAAGSTTSSARRCARPARSWASTRPSARRSPSRRPRRTAGCRPRARSSSRSPTATSGR